MEFKHPKYYAEMRKLRRAQASKLTSSQAIEPRVQAHKPRAQASSPPEPGSGSQIQGTSVPSPCPGNKQQE
jgi:hypothetical protein